MPPPYGMMPTLHDSLALTKAALEAEVKAMAAAQDELQSATKVSLEAEKDAAMALLAASTAEEKLAEEQAARARARPTATARPRATATATAWRPNRMAPRFP